jgi:hypothetical protein
LFYSAVARRGEGRAVVLWAEAEYATASAGAACWREAGATRRGHAPPTVWAAASTAWDDASTAASGAGTGNAAAAGRRDSSTAGQYAA